MEKYALVKSNPQSKTIELETPCLPKTCQRRVLARDMASSVVKAGTKIAILVGRSTTTRMAL
jgi:hypothetical protein